MLCQAMFLGVRTCAPWPRQHLSGLRFGGLGFTAIGLIVGFAGCIGVNGAYSRV